MAANYIYDDETDEIFAKRIDWPLHQMLPGQTYKLIDPEQVARRGYVHTFARSKGWKMRTKIADGALYVQRIS